MVPTAEDHHDVAAEAHRLHRAGDHPLEVDAEGRAPSAVQIRQGNDEDGGDDWRQEVQCEREPQSMQPEEIERYEREARVGRELRRNEFGGTDYSQRGSRLIRGGR